MNFPGKMLFVAVAALASVCSAAENRTGISIGEPVTIAEGTVARPQAAFGDGVFLVVWRSGWPGWGGTADISGRRVDAQTLRFLDPEPIRICAAEEVQDAPQVAYRDGVFLVVWQDMRGGLSFDIRGRLIDASTGRLRGSEIVIADRSSALERQATNQVRPAVAATDEGFLVVWQDWRGEGKYGISSRHLRVSGPQLDEPQKLADLGASPVVARSGKNLLVCWVTGNSRGATHGVLLNANDGSLAKPLGTLIPNCQHEPSVAGDRDGNFVCASSRAPYPDPWGWGGPGAVVCARVRNDGTMPERALEYGYRSTFLSERKVPNVVDAASWGNEPRGKWNAGAPGGFPGTHDGLWPHGWPAAVHAGDKLYMFAWVKGEIAGDRLTLSNHDIWLRGLDEDSLKVRIDDLKVPGNKHADETRPTLVARSSTQILLLHEEIRPAAPRRIVARHLELQMKKAE